MGRKYRQRTVISTSNPDGIVRPLGGKEEPRRVPTNILVAPLKAPPMEPIKDAAARPGLEEED